MIFYLLIIIITIILLLTYKFIYRFEYVTFKTKPQKATPKNILLVNMEKFNMGGGEIHTINIYKNMLKQNYNVSLLIAKNSKLETELKKIKLPFYAYRKFRIHKNVFQPAFYKALYQICKHQKIKIVHSNVEKEIKTIRKVAKKLPIKIIQTRHIPFPIRAKYAKNLNGLICVNPKNKETIQQENIKQQLKIKNIAFIPPFFEDDKFLNFKPTEKNKSDFFKKEFNVNINSNIPILCMIARIDAKIKNHKLLFQATNILINQENIPIQIILVGGGDNKNLKLLTEQFNIQNHIHFLGFTNKTADVLYHSDIKILASKNEAFPICLLEAALMKKPLIGATQTGMEQIIKHEQTGLLFENNNIDSLVYQIKILINNPELQKALGENAFRFVVQNFTTQKSMLKLDTFYNKILEN